MREVGFIMEWDAENRPVRWTDGARTLLMAYDHLGRRVRLVETAGGATNRVVAFLYDGYGCIARTEGGVTDRFVRDPSTGRPLAMVADGRAYLYAHDANGNVAALVDAGTGEVAARYAYAAFGATLMSEGPLARRNPFRFSSEYADDETGLVYYNWRHYDPVHGTWLGRDPIGPDGGANLYAFCGNRPLDRVDELGLLPELPQESFFSNVSDRKQFQIRDYVEHSYACNEVDEKNWSCRILFTARFTPPPEVERRRYKQGLFSKIIMGDSRLALGGSVKMFEIDKSRGDLNPQAWGMARITPNPPSWANVPMGYSYVYNEKLFRFGYFAYCSEGSAKFEEIESNRDVYSLWTVGNMARIIPEEDLGFSVTLTACEKLLVMYGDAGYTPKMFLLDMEKFK